MEMSETYATERRINLSLVTCALPCGSALFREGHTIYCCKCDYTRPARREEDKKIATKEDWNGK
jgi:hypothetical protein